MLLQRSADRSWRARLTTDVPVDGASVLLRAGLALTFTISGLERLLRGGDYAAAYFASLGIAWPEITGPLVSWLELLAGLAILAGLLTRPAAAFLAVDMLVALIAVRIPVALQAPSLADAVNSVRLEVMLACGSLALALLGPGRWSVDAWMRGRRLPTMRSR